MSPNSTGIILLNMGGPEKQEDVRPFLYNLFSDREIIRLGPRFMQKPLAWWIAKRRAPKSKKTYALIGGGSPLNTISRQQGEALEQALLRDGDFLVTCAMRYWQPDSAQALNEMASMGVTKLIALSLYPHYCCATTGSSIQALQRAIEKSNNTFELTCIDSYPDQADYIEALVNKINAAAAQFDDSFQLVYSAHSLPVSFIEEGDPYVEQLQQTIKAIEKQIKISGELCYQSRSGPVTWLSPSTPEMLETLAAKGCKNVLMVPISFVSDHVETLYEIDMLYRDQARNLGLKLVSSESLNCDPIFIEGLRKLVLSHR